MTSQEPAADEGQQTDPSTDGANGETGKDEGAGTGEAIALEKPSGVTDFDDALEFEVVTLALSALQDIAGEIASRVRKWAGSEASSILIVIADDGFSARIAEWQALAMRMGVLESAMEELLRERDAAAARNEALSLAPIQGATAAVEAVAHLLSFFKADTTYGGRKPDLDNSALYPAVAGRLIEAGMAQIVFGSDGVAGAAASASVTLIGRLERLLCLRERLEAILPNAPDKESHEESEEEEFAPDERPSEAAETSSGAASGGKQPAPAGGRQGTSSPAATNLSRTAEGGVAVGPGKQEERVSDRLIRSLVGAVDALATELAGGEGKKPGLAEMQAMSEVAALIDAASQAVLLSPKVLKTGGHYRTRRHLFTTLFTGDQLSYSGGAAVSFVLSDLKSGRVLLGDVLYHGSGKVRFPSDVKELNGSNLGRLRDRSHRTRNGAPEGQA